MRRKELTEKKNKKEYDTLTTVALELLLLTEVIETHEGGDVGL